MILLPTILCLRVCLCVYVSVCLLRVCVCVWLRAMIACDDHGTPQDKTEVVKQIHSTCVYGLAHTEARDNLSMSNGHIAVNGQR